MQGVKNRGALQCSPILLRKDEKEMKFKKYITAIMIICICSTGCGNNEENNNYVTNFSQSVITNDDTAIESMNEVGEENCISRNTILNEEKLKPEYSWTEIAWLNNVEVCGFLYSVLPCHYGEEAGAVINDGYYLAKRNNSYGLLNSCGIWEIYPEYAEISYHNDYLLKVSFSEATPIFSLDNDGKRRDLSQDDSVLVLERSEDSLAAWDIEKNCQVMLDRLCSEISNMYRWSIKN